MSGNQPATVTILGSGTSTGVPVIGCSCVVCRSPDSRLKRTRAALMLTLASGERLVIDTGPDFRQQMLRESVAQLEHVLYTHVHADHCHGFDDLRAFYFHQRRPVTCYVGRPHLEDFRTRFAYAFQETGYSGTKPQVVLQEFGEAPFTVLGLTVEPIFLEHGHTQTAAFRIGRFVYATDFKRIPPEVVERWRGQVDTMVASGIHFGAHPTHSNIPETLALFKKIQVNRGIITHLTHEVDPARDTARLPDGVVFAHDGMQVDVLL